MSTTQLNKDSSRLEFMVAVAPMLAVIIWVAAISLLRSAAVRWRGC